MTGMIVIIRIGSFVLSACDEGLERWRGYIEGGEWRERRGATALMCMHAPREEEEQDVRVSYIHQF